MGYWEQVGVANRHHRERLERMRPLHRKLRATIGIAGVTLASLFLWAVLLAPAFI